MWSLLLLVILLSVPAHCEPWDEANDPAQFSSSYNYKFAQVKPSGKTTVTPWSDTYWPSFQGGIANRWQDEANGQPGFNYKLYTLAELRANAVDINILSPAEKFDLYLGRYDYPLVQSEWQRVSPQDPQWEGLCHGWVPAAEDYQQPDAFTTTNEDGLKIPFGSSDIKALLTYFLAQYAVQRDVKFAAQRCNTDIRKETAKENAPECRDINPGAFLVILANEVAANRAFAIDIDRSIEVWNQPVFAYTLSASGRRQPSNGSAPGTASEVRASLSVSYVKEVVPQVHKYSPYVLQLDYDIWLELDQDGNILGGTWNEWDRPDFAWQEPAPAFYGDFAKLKELYQQSIKPSTSGLLNRLVSKEPSWISQAIKAPVGGATVTEGTLKRNGTVIYFVSGPTTVHVKSDRATGFRVRVFDAKKSSTGVVSSAFTAPVGRTARNVDVKVGNTGAYVVVDAPRSFGSVSGAVRIEW